MLLTVLVIAAAFLSVVEAESPKPFAPPDSGLALYRNVLLQVWEAGPSIDLAA